MSQVAKHPLEWVVFALSAVLVAATVGYLAYDAVRRDDAPPLLSVEIGQAEPRAGSQGLWRVPVTVRNRGHETAEGVRVEVTLETPGSPPETADFDVVFVPRESKREGWVTFRGDPSRGRLTGRAIGYEKP
jgi:uncharacterized protein (TIGR02588 family)